MTLHIPTSAKDIHCHRRNGTWLILKGGRLVGCHADGAAAWDLAQRLAEGCNGRAAKYQEGPLIEAVAFAERAS